MAPKVCLKSFITGKSTGSYKRNGRNPLILTKEGSLTNSVWLLKNDYMFLFPYLEKRAKRKDMLCSTNPSDKDLWPDIDNLETLIFDCAVMDDDSEHFDDKTCYIYMSDKCKIAFTAINIEYLSKCVPEFNLRLELSLRGTGLGPAVIFSGNVPIGMLMNVRIDS